MHWTLEPLFQCYSCDWVGTVDGICPYCRCGDFHLVKNTYREIICAYSAIDEPTADDAHSLFDQLSELLGIEDFDLSLAQRKICFHAAEMHSVNEARNIAFDIEEGNRIASVDIYELTRILA